MRMKEDHMKNGQLKPAYNLQLSTNNQYIANYSLHQNTTDTNTLIPHLEEIKTQYQQTPEVVTTDAGYGSKENYEYLSQNNIEAYVKYNHFDREQSKTLLGKKPFAPENLYYNKELDRYICPMGQPMGNAGTYSKVTTTGFSQRVTKYQAVDCSRCPLNGACHKSKGNRVIEVNHNLNLHKIISKQKLESATGIYHRKKIAKKDVQM